MEMNLETYDVVYYKSLNEISTSNYVSHHSSIYVKQTQKHNYCYQTDHMVKQPFSQLVKITGISFVK